MKKSTLIALSVVAVAALLVPAGSAMAQSASAAGSATATIVRPLTLAASDTLRFGNIAVGTTGGTVTITPANVLSFSGDSTPISGLPTGPASFNVTGASSLGFSISLPSTSTTITNGTAAQDMTVSPLTLSAASGTLSSAALGLASFTVGGTLTVAGSQAAGNYTGTFNVMVAYN